MSVIEPPVEEMKFEGESVQLVALEGESVQLVAPSVTDESTEPPVL